MSRPEPGTGDRIAAALRARASASPGAPAAHRPPTERSRGLPARLVLLAAVVLGAIAGLVAALVSTL